MEKLKIRKRFYHGYSNGKKTGTLFMCKADYVEAMNRMAFCAAMMKGKVEVVVFCIMKTHVHILLYGSAKDCARFLELFDTLTVRHIKKTGRAISELYFDLREVPEGEGVKSEFAYILRNPTQAGLSVFPWEYPWGSGSLYFMKENWELDVLDTEFQDGETSVDTIDSIPSRKKRDMFHSVSFEMPGEWTIYKGIVLPSNYISTQKNYADFSNKKDYLYYIGKIRDDKSIDQVIEENSNQNIGVAELKSMLTRMFLSRYNGTSYKRVRDLPIEDRQSLAIELNENTKASLWMIAKAIELRFDEVASAIMST